MTSQPPPSDPLFIEDLAPWNENPNPIWLASTLLLRRNIEKYHFPSKLVPERRKQIVALIGKEMARLPGLDQPKLLKSEECTAIDKEFLLEHCLASENFLQATQGEAFIFDGHGKTLLTVNIEDHLHLHHIDVKEELEKGWNQLVAMESYLGKTLSYSYSPKFGFLTANPFVCGTGLLVSIFLQVSALIHTNQLNEVLSQLADESIAIAGLLGKPQEFVGDLVVATNSHALGVNEESILAAMRNFATKLLVEERKVRQQLQEQENAEMKDKVARAFGALIHSYQIETVEALNEIALLKLGLELGWIKGISMVDLNKLFFSCRRAHLIRNLSEKIALENVSHKRTEFIHRSLENLLLTI